MSEQVTSHEHVAPLTRRRFLGTASAAALAAAAP